MKKKVLIIVIGLIIIIGAISLIYLFTPIGMGICNNLLNKKQLDSFEKKVVNWQPNYIDEFGLEHAIVYKFDIFGMRRQGKYIIVYCYETDHEYIKYKNKAYYDPYGSGGEGIYAYKIKTKGNKVSSIKRLNGEGYYLYRNIPLIYKYISNFKYDHTKPVNLSKELKKSLGVEKHLESEFDLDIDTGKYKIYDIDDELNEKIIEQGVLKKSIIN